MSITSLSPQQLRQAADLQEKILELQTQLTDLLGGGTSTAITQDIAVTSKPAKGKKGKRTFSPETRAKMAASQQARWAAKKGLKVTKPARRVKPAPKAKKTKEQVTEARLGALAKAREARWAKVRASKKAEAQLATTIQEAPNKKKKASPALLKALERARAARSAKAKAARSDVPF